MKTPYLDNLIKGLEDGQNKGINSYYLNCQLRELIDIKEQLNLHVVGCSLPTKDEISSKLRQLDKRWELSKNLDEKQAFNHGFKSCIRWFKEKIE